MLIKIDSHEMKKRYTVKNKNIEKQEKMMGRKLYHLHDIKMYSRSWYVTVWQHGRKLKPIHKLTNEFVYKASREGVPEDIINEQEHIMLQIWLGDVRTGLIEMKTARGKWNLLLQIIANFQEKTLILVHNQKTLQDMKWKFAKFTNYEPWEWWSKKKKEKEIMITTHASFKKKFRDWKWQFGIIIYDEADVNLKDTMIEALAEVDCEGLFWLTGTPSRQDLDIDDLQLVYWPLIRLEWQVRNWYNMLPNITQLKYQWTISSRNDFHDLRTMLIEDEKRIEAQVKFISETQDRWLSLILVSWKIECTIYKKMLDKLNIPNVIINSDTRLEDDEKNITDMIARWGIIIGTSWKIGRGVDIPAVQSIFLFYPVAFKGNVVQAVWRALRFYPWKDKVYLYDWCDSQISGQWYKRRQAYVKEYPLCNIETINIS